VSDTYDPATGVEEDDFNAQRIRPSAKVPPFHIGQSYDEWKAVPQECAKCGGLTFHLGRGDYYTAVRCTECGLEHCVHSG
jgi:hypothetical protein